MASYKKLGILIAQIAAGMCFTLLLSYTYTVADEKKTHEGTVVSAAGGKLTMMGPDGKEHSHDISPEVPVTVNGKMGELEDLTKGMHVRVTTDAGGNVVSISTVDEMKRLESSIIK